MKLEVTPECYHSYIAKKGKHDILTITPNCYYELLDKFSEILKELTPDTKYVYGIPKGGVSIAQYLAYNMNIDLIFEPEKVIDHFLLIVDDVLDTGKTIEWFQRKYPRCSTAVLHRKPIGNRDPLLKNRYHYPTTEPAGIEANFYLHNIDGHIWIRYPYEPIDDPINR